jgi:hypothetical protein
MKRGMLNLGIPIILSVASLGCTETQTVDTSTTTQEIASVMGGVEWSIDAPWRMEPPFGPIPITIAFHDASEQKDPETEMLLRRFCGVSIVQLTGGKPEDPHYVQKFAPDRFHEFEAHAKWPYSSDVAALHKLERIWAGETPSAGILRISDSAEWTATLMYTPNVGVATNNDVYLQITAIVSDTSTCPALADLPFETTTNHIGLGGLREDHRLGARIFRQALRVHYGQAMPKFDNRWVYGDLHYHSQGTDNEGESGLAFRPVLHSMKAMGLDFAFATDHASDSGQVTDIDGIYAANLPDWVPEWLEDWLVGKINEKLGETGIPYESAVDALRDLSAARFTHLLGWLNDSGGANQDILSGSHPTYRAPQIFLGGEADVIPEVSSAEKSAGLYKYGNNRTYRWGNACTDVPSAILDIDDQYTTFDLCPDNGAGLTELASEGGRYLLRDVQGLGSNYFARQHILHLPTNPARTDAFVSSETTHYGGAFRRLKDMIATDYTAANKGFFFLAHPVSAPSGNGPGRMGPDILPYSDVQLRTAFDSQHFLGLQLWNENDQLRSVGTQYFPRHVLPRLLTGAAGDRQWNWFTGWESSNNLSHLSALHHGARVWDRMLLWGLEPSKKPAWLASGPRKVFMAGGSDAHGDLNWRRWGAIIGTIHATDSKIGSPRNLLYVGSERPVSVMTGARWTTTIGQTQVVDALRTGSFTVTDGPAIRIVIDRNNNGEIDDTDVPMGGSYDWSGPVPLIIQWKSTAEFGPINEINLYVGVQASTTQTQVYASYNHGVRTSSDPSGTATKSYSASNGTVHKLLSDGYAVDPTGKLKITPSASVDGWNYRYVGTRRVTLYPNQYPAFTASCTPKVECEPYDPETDTEPFCTFEETCVATGVKPPERMYVRAMIKGTQGGEFQATTGEPGAEEQIPLTVKRLAYTNPIWLKPSPILPPTPELAQ